MKIFWSLLFFFSWIVGVVASANLIPFLLRDDEATWAPFFFVVATGLVFFSSQRLSKIPILTVIYGCCVGCSLVFPVVLVPFFDRGPTEHTYWFVVSLVVLYGFAIALPYFWFRARSGRAKTKTGCPSDSQTHQENAL